MTGRVMQPRKRHESKGSTLSKNGEDRSAEKRPDTPTKETSEVRRSLPGSKNSARHQKSSARKPGDLEGALPSKVDGGQAREGDSSRAEAQPRTFEKSDACMVPGKSPNAWVTPAEGMEGRRAAKGKLADGNASRSQSRQDVLTQVERVGQRASVKKEEKFTNLLCHIKVPLLAEAYYCLRKNAAPGVDGETWSSYGLDLEAKLLDLEGRVHRGSYHPQPVRRVHIPKGNGRTRPLGIPALEDKIVQQAVRMILEPIYEEEFLGFSYGFRPGRSQHQALDALAVAINRRVSWVLDADIRSFFDTIDHEWLKRFVEHRIGDKRLVRLLMKWLHAGVLEDGEIHEVEEGTPQGESLALFCRISISTTCSIDGSSNGGSRAREARCISCAMPMTLWRPFSLKTTRMRCTRLWPSASRSIVSSFTPRKRVYSALGVLPERAARRMAENDLRRSCF
jgi:hypothetical protein